MKRNLIVPRDASGRRLRSYPPRERPKRAEVRAAHEKQRGKCANAGCHAPIRATGLDLETRALLCKRCAIALGVCGRDLSVLIGLVSYLQDMRQRRK